MQPLGSVLIWFDGEVLRCSSYRPKEGDKRMKYGVKLVSYDGAPMGLFIHGEGGREEYEKEVEAEALRDAYKLLNPKGEYCVVQLLDTSNW